MTTPAIEIPGYIAGTWGLDPVHSHVGFVARHRHPGSPELSPLS